MHNGGKKSLQNNINRIIYKSKSSKNSLKTIDILS